MYERRLKVFLIVTVAAVAVIVVRLADMQLVRGDQYRRRAEALLTWVELLPTVRGKVLDRKGRVLACDEACYDFCLDYRMLKGPGSTRSDRRAYERWVRQQVRDIRRREEISRERAEAIFDQRLGRTWDLAIELTGATRNEMSRAAENAVVRVEAIRRGVGGPVRDENLAHAVVPALDEATAVKVRSRLGEMVGASVRPSYRRWYPCGRDACHVIGFLGPLSDRQRKDARAGWETDAPLETKLAAHLSGDLIGASGVERLCEDLLRGRRGYRRLRRTGRTLEEVHARIGKNVHLTLDIELQHALAGELVRIQRERTGAARPGAIVVLDVPTGEVLAMVSLPTYDLNTYRREFATLIADQVRLPLLDRTVAVRYPPGSTVKPLAALAALATGTITPGTQFNCRGYLHNPGAFRCWIWERHRIGHGLLEVVGAIEHSCNVFFYNVGERLGLRRQVEWLGRFGFADRPGTQLPGEIAGLLPDPHRVQGAGEARFLAIGQGKITVTPMHVAAAIATIARGGVFRSPLLVRELSDKQQVRRLRVSAGHVSLVQEGMYKVVNSAHGTARKYFSGEEIQICGKTGTAETAPRRIRIDSNGDGRLDRWGPVVCTGDTAWFVGFAPYRNPRIAFAVMVEYSDTGGGETCGPIARQVVHVCRAFGYLGKQ